MDADPVAKSAAMIVALAGATANHPGLPDEVRDLLCQIRDEIAELITILQHRDAATPGGIRTLTFREREVFELLCEGRSTAQISQRLGTRPTTTRGHVQSIMMKLCVRSRLEAIAAARKAA